MKKLLFATSILFLSDWAHSVERIQSIRLNRGQVERVYLSPGLGTVIHFPCAVVEAFVVRTADLKTQISPTDQKFLFLNLKLNSSLPANMVVRCANPNDVFVFDVIPSQTKHQDYVEVRSTFGRAGKLAEAGLTKTKSTQSFRKVVTEKPKLISKGGGR